MNVKVVGTIVVLLMLAVIGLGWTTLHYVGEKGRLEQSITDLNGTIENQEDTIRNLEGDIELRERISTELAIEKTNLMNNNSRLVEENKRLLEQGPRIVETVKVIETIKYVQLEAVEKKVNGHYENLYRAIGAKQ